MKCDILITDGSILTPGFGVTNDVSIAINDTRIVEIGNSEKLKAKCEPKEVISGRNKLVMPGLVDGHIHCCQQLLRDVSWMNTPWYGPEYWCPLNPV